jgi:hypothetical protein
VFKPIYIYVVILFGWPTGPSPLLINNEFILGAGNPAAN